MLCAFLVACAGTCGGDYIAELETLSGDVRRDEAKAQGTWMGAAAGDRLAMGDGLRTGNKSVARLKLFPEGVALVEPNTVMRFLAQAPGKNKDRITLEEGAVELETQSLDLEVHTALAVARLEKGSRVRVRAGEEGGADVRFDVLVGRVTVEHEDGSVTNLEEGGELSLNAPGSDGEQKAATKAASPRDGPGTGGEDATTSPDLVMRPDFNLKQLENATIHVASLPLDVRVALQPCDDGSSTSLDVAGPGGRNVLMPSRGNEHVVVRLGAGVYRLKLRCGKKTVRSEGTLKVQRDPATMELPKTTPHVEVEADGRRYTVRYQNVLPVVSLSWGNAPVATGYTLFINKGGRELRYDLPRPNHELRSGELGEGEYQFHFTASDGSRSAAGALRIIFDNTARSAYLSSPAEGATRPSDSFPVAGAALLRSEVSVEGIPVALDAQGRFRTSVPPDVARGTLAVRVSHPVTGVHYYLRRFR